MSPDMPRPAIVVVYRNGLATPLLLAFVGGVMLLATIALLLSEWGSLGTLLLGTATATVTFGAWKAWQLRNREYRAEISGTDVRWVERQETRIVHFDELNHVTVWVSTDPNTFKFVLKNGRVIDPGAGFPDASALFRAVRKRFRGKMVYDGNEVPPPVSAAEHEAHPSST
jgi:hypothetical protein